MSVKTCISNVYRLNHSTDLKCCFGVLRKKRTQHSLSSFEMRISWTYHNYSKFFKLLSQYHQNPNLWVFMRMRIIMLKLNTVHSTSQLCSLHKHSDTYNMHFQQIWNVVAFIPRKSVLSIYYQVLKWEFAKERNREVDPKRFKHWNLTVEHTTTHYEVNIGNNLQLQNLRSNSNENQIIFILLLDSLFI